MNSSMNGGKFAYSYNEEDYHGTYDTFDQAKTDGMIDCDGGPFWVGKTRSPEVLGYIDADDLIEIIRQQDDYLIEAAENAFDCTREQEAELTQMLRDTFKAWLDKHQLWPTHFLVEEAEKVVLETSV